MTNHQDPIVEAALSLLKMLHAKGGRVLGGSEIYLAVDLERFIQNRERELAGNNLNKLFE